MKLLILLPVCAVILLVGINYVSALKKEKEANEKGFLNRKDFEQLYTLYPDDWKYDGGLWMRHKPTGRLLRLTDEAYMWWLNESERAKTEKSNAIRRNHKIAVLQYVQAQIQEEQEQAQQQIQSALKQQKQILKDWKW